jgi:hypothetical protein
MDETNSEPEEWKDVMGRLWLYAVVNQWPFGVELALESVDGVAVGVGDTGGSGAVGMVGKL